MLLTPTFINKKTSVRIECGYWQQLTKYILHKPSIWKPHVAICDFRKWIISQSDNFSTVRFTGNYLRIKTQIELQISLETDEKEKKNVEKKYSVWQLQHMCNYVSCQKEEVAVFRTAQAGRLKCPECTH